MTAVAQESSALAVLSPEQQASQALSVAATKEALVALAAKSHGLTVITDKAGYQQVHRARIALRDMRVEITRVGKEARDGANKFSKAVIAAERDLVALIEPEEDRLASLQQAVDEAERLAKEAAEQAERERVAAVTKRFDDLRALPGRTSNVAEVDVPAIEALIAEAEAFDPESFTEDLHAAAAYERRICIASLRAAIDRRFAWETEQAQAARDRAELEELRAARAERDRLDREEADRVERANHERLKAEAAERDRLAAVETAERQERERVEREERAERQRVEDEAREADRVRLADERRRLDLEKAEAAARERDRAIGEATLRSAAEEAIQVLQHVTLSDPFNQSKVSLVIEKLQAALNRDAADAAAPVPGGAA